MVVRIGLIVVALMLVGLLLLGIGAGVGIVKVSSDGIAFAGKDDKSAGGSEIKSNVVSADDLLKREGVKYVEPAPAVASQSPQPAVVAPASATIAPKAVLATSPPKAPATGDTPVASIKENRPGIDPAPAPTPRPAMAEGPAAATARSDSGDRVAGADHGDRAVRDVVVDRDRGQNGRAIAVGNREDPNIVRVAAGSDKPLTDPEGHVWEPGAASGFDGGATSSRGDIEIHNTRFPALCRYERWGSITWRRRLANGRYTVLLHFAETYDAVTGPNQRLFGVDVQGQRLDNLDIFKEAGGRRREIIKNFHVEVANEKLMIKFIATNTRVPAINGIEVIPDGPVAERMSGRGEGRDAPVAIRIAAGSAVPVRDPHGDVWEPDNGFDKGTIVDRGPITIDKTDIPIFIVPSITA
ncbi:MAG TPA: malectin domain-containing carbohydrate-binding protein [Tepidisphaeraceae bacterium]|jgi:hypothetical protein|nr:malectin domain-containing carbohydrate-binding protein [Tepidisphaeraceae bacterium]